MHFHPAVRQRHSYFELAYLGQNELSLQALSSTESFRFFCVIRGFGSQLLPTGKKVLAYLELLAWTLS